MIEGKSDVKLAQTTILRRASNLAVQRVCRWLLAAWLALTAISGSVPDVPIRSRPQCVTEGRLGDFWSRLLASRLPFLSSICFLCS